MSAVAPRIFQQGMQFTFDVAEVDIERSDARLKRAEQGLDEFVAVVGVYAKKVLTHLVAGERGALGATPQPARMQVRGKPVRSFDDLRVAVAPVTLDDVLPIADRGRDGLGDGGHRELSCRVGHQASHGWWG